MIEKKITILPGDGIGPEIMYQAARVLEAVQTKFGHKFHIESKAIGAVAIEKSGNPLPLDTLESCMESDAVLLAAIGDPKYDNDPDLAMRPEQGLLGLRKALGLFANIRPIQTHPALHHLSQLKSVSKDQIDIVIFRELSSGIYYGKRKEDLQSDEATDECYYNREEIERITRRAFEAARKRNHRLCLVDKANVLATSRLWRRVVNNLSEDYPDIELTHLFVDNAAMQLVLNPSQFDVILCGNMFGDIISDLASTIPGSIGLLPSASYGERNALFEPVHGSYPQVAGQNVANPIAMIRSVAMMMEYFGLSAEVKTIERVIEACIKSGLGTIDLKTETVVTTSEFGNIVAIAIEEDLDNVDVKNMCKHFGSLI